MATDAILPCTYYVAKDAEDIPTLWLERGGHNDLAVQRSNDVAEVVWALVEKAYPLREEEPAGLGAVVEDKNGLLWVRFTLDGASDNGCWACADNPTFANTDWDDILVARVLHRGWHA